MYVPLETVVLIVVAGLFAAISGMNDGGALLATGLKLPSVRPLTGILTMVVMITLIPLLTTKVAQTFVTRLASFEGPGAQQAMTVAVISALAVVTELSRRGRPTSLTLAIVGGLTGAGLGWGLTVSGAQVALVLAFGLAAPFAGAVSAWVISRLLLHGTSTRELNGWHRIGFLLQCVAYAANDGQKMLAVFMIALSTSAASLPVTLVVSALFGIGALYGMPRAGRTLSREILASRPLHGVAAELGSGFTVMVCAAIGMPVSMTQAIAGGLIGTGVARGAGRVRWHAAIRIVTAWALTLPASALLAGVLAVVVKEFTS